MSLTKDQITSVKKRGFRSTAEPNVFPAVVTVAGLFTPDELRAVAECADKFGSGKVILPPAWQPRYWEYL